MIINDYNDNNNNNNFLIGGIQKEYLFCQKWYIKGQGIGIRGRASSSKTLMSTLPGMLFCWQYTLTQDQVCRLSS